MDTRLQSICEKFVENKRMMKAGFFWESSLMYPVCASMLTQKGIFGDTDHIKECKKLIKSKNGSFSQFRGTTNLALATMLSMEESPEDRLCDIMDIYEQLREEFHRSPYLPLTAYSLSTNGSKEELSMRIKKARELYRMIKSQHPMITSSEDCGMIAMLALSDQPTEAIADHVEECYRTLHGEFFSGNAVQALSLTLALGDASVQSKCSRALTIFQSLKKAGYKYGTGMELATLGVLALTELSTDEIVRTIIEVTEFLKSQSGFGAFSMSRGQRTMFAAMLTVIACCNDEDASQINAAAAHSITSIIIAQQIAMCAAASAAAASAAASS